MSGREREAAGEAGSKECGCGCGCGAGGEAAAGSTAFQAPSGAAARQPMALSAASRLVALSAGSGPAHAGSVAAAASGGEEAAGQAGLHAVPGEAGGDVRVQVRERYGQAALRVLGGGGSGCGCGGGGSGTAGCCGDGAAAADSVITRELYDAVSASELPAPALLASLGCGNPTALAELGPGEVVLDLGSGGGIDVLLSAKRVGPWGRVYGLDMTDEMLDLARRNAHAAGATNVEFLKGEMESIPLPDASVDVIISNCVINLSVDKRRVLAEAYRVLRPGGRFAVSDVVVRGEVPAELRRSVELWMGCLAGALEEQEFLALLGAVGFEAASIEPTRVYGEEAAREFLAAGGAELEGVADAVDGRFAAAFVRARKPVGDAVRLRGATAADLPAVLGLLERAVLPMDGVAECFASFIIAEAGGELVGAAGLERYGTDVLLRSVVVRPDWRGRGLGEALTRRVLASAAAGGTGGVYLLTNTAERFFRRLGFSRIERGEVPVAVRNSVEFLSCCPSSAVVMVRSTEPDISGEAAVAGG